MKKIIAVLAALGLSSIGLIAVAAPASAHHNTVSGQAVCQSDGTYTVNWTVTNSQSDKTENVTLIASTGGGTLTGLPTDIGYSGSAAVTQTGVGLNTTATLEVRGVWKGYTTDNSGSVTTGGDCKIVVAPVEPEVVKSTECEVNGSVTPAVTRGVVYVVGGTSPTAITVTATPAQGFKFAEGDQVVYGPYDVSASTCPTPTPTPTPEPTPPPQPPKDFCPDLAGLQWENYDCNTTVVIPPTPTPTETPVVIPTPEPTATPTETVTVEVTIPDKPTVPKDVPAGDGSSQNDTGLLWLAFAVALLASVTAIVFALINRKK
jgi:hypothetical protein